MAAPSSRPWRCVALVSPPFIGAYAWIVLFGASGVIRRGLASIGISIPPLYGVAGVILVFAFKFFPHVFLITSGALAAINRSVEEAAESLGVSPAKRLFTVTFPLILPAISASALLTFVLSIADFGTPRIIGRDFNVLATEAFKLYRQRGRRQSRHGVGAQHRADHPVDDHRVRAALGAAQERLSQQSDQEARARARRAA